MEELTKLEKSRGWEMRRCGNPSCDNRFKVKSRHKNPKYCSDCRMPRNRAEMYRRKIAITNRGILKNYNLRSFRIIQNGAEGFGLKPNFESLYLGHSKKDLKDSGLEILEHLYKIKKTIEKDIELLVGVNK